jgi:hypothetical protein
VQIALSCRIVGMAMRRFSLHLAIIGGFGLLTVVLTYPLIFHLTTHIPVHKDWHSSGSEHWTSIWAFWFIERSILEVHQWSLFTDMIFYPRKVDLANATILGFGLPLAVAIPFIRYIGLILTFNLIIISSFILTAYSTFLLVRHLTDNSRAAFISGVMFAFSSYQMARALTMFSVVTSSTWIPLYILSFIKAVYGRQTRQLIFAALLLTLTIISHAYYAVFLGIFSLIYVAYHLIANGNAGMRSILLRRSICLACLTALFSLPIIWLILSSSTKDFLIDLPMAPEFGADLLAFFIPSTHHTLWGEFVKSIYYTHFTGNDIEQTVYISFTGLFLSIVALVKARKEKTRIWSLTAFIFLILSLGPYLHIGGKSEFRLHGVSSMLPLPSMLLYFLPLLRAVRAYSRFSVMLMLALAVLVGYGTNSLLVRLEGRSRAVIVCLGFIGVIICFEFSTIPLPLADARIPKLYNRVATESSQGGTLLDVPLYWFITKYQYYQTAHLKRLLIGQAPRISPALLQGYAEEMPLMRLFRDPELIKDYEQLPIDKRDITRFIDFFDLSLIVIHKNLLHSGLFDHLRGLPNLAPRVIRLQGPEVFDRLMRFLLANFPIAHVEEEGDIVALQLSRSHDPGDLWFENGRYLVDFGVTAPQVFLSEGWSNPERWDNDLTVAWANNKESRLWLYFSRVEDLVMELRLRPFAFAGSPLQTIKLYINGKFIKEVPLALEDWQTYTVQLPPVYLTTGINTFRFEYGYTESPSRVEPKNSDNRTLAVAFDYIAFHQK